MLGWDCGGGGGRRPHSVCPSLCFGVQVGGHGEGWQHCNPYYRLSLATSVPLPLQGWFYVTSGSARDREARGVELPTKKMSGLERHLSRIHVPWHLRLLSWPSAPRLSVCKYYTHREYYSSFGCWCIVKLNCLHPTVIHEVRVWTILRAAMVLPVQNQPLHFFW